MSKCAGSDGVFGKLVAHIRCPKAVSNASVLGRWIAKLHLDSLNPFGHMLVCESHMLPLPGFVIKIWIAAIVPIFPVLPHGILFAMSKTDR